MVFFTSPERLLLYKYMGKTPPSIHTKALNNFAHFPVSTPAAPPSLSRFHSSLFLLQKPAALMHKHVNAYTQRRQIFSKTLYEHLSLKHFPARMLKCTVSNNLQRATLVVKLHHLKNIILILHFVVLWIPQPPLLHIFILVSLCTEA